MTRGSTHLAFYIQNSTPFPLQLYVQRQSKLDPVVTSAAANILGDAQAYVYKSSVRHVSINGITLGKANCL